MNMHILLGALRKSYRVIVFLQIVALSVALFRALNLTTRYGICYNKNDNNISCYLL